MSIENTKIIDLGNHPEFKSSHLRQKNLVLIPSQGEANTNILVGIEGEMLYEQRQAGQVTSENPGIFVSRIPLPKSEEKYRQQVFGDMNPKWLVPNLKKHGVRFEDAVVVFSDINALEMIDSESAREEGIIRIGLNPLKGIFVVVYCERKENIIRIISARKATLSEEKEYEKRV